MSGRSHPLPPLPKAGREPLKKREGWNFFGENGIGTADSIFTFGKSSPFDFAICASLAPKPLSPVNIAKLRNPFLPSKGRLAKNGFLLYKEGGSDVRAAFYFLAGRFRGRC